MTSNELSNAGVKKTVAPAPLPEKNAIITEAQQVQDGSGKTVHHHGNCIYMPNGKAREYSSWACNLYVGCTHMCSYCYNDHGIMKGAVGGQVLRYRRLPRLSRMH